MNTVTISRRRAIIAITALVAVAALTITISVVALTRTADANDKFNDIATGTFFHEPTKWLADNDIADGFGDGSFKPNNGITRGQASYWLSNYNDTIELVFSDRDPGPSSFFTHITNCPTGKRPVAGAGRSTALDMFVRDSFPNPHSGTPTGWQVRWETANDETVDPSQLLVWVLCVPDNV